MTDCGQVLWYKMDETSGSTAFDSVDSRDATIADGVDLGQTPPPFGNGSFDFHRASGVNSYLYYPLEGDDLGLTDFMTVAVWVKDEFPVGVNHNEAIFLRRTASGPTKMRLGVQSGVDVRWSPGDTATTMNAEWSGGCDTLRDGSFHLLVATFDATIGVHGRAQLWADAGLVATNTFPNDPAWNPSAGDLWIATRSNVSDWFEGPMGDFQVFDYVLSEDEIASMYATGEPCTEPPPEPEPEPTPAGPREDVYWDELGFVSEEAS